MFYTVYLDYAFKGWILEAVVKESANSIGLKLNLVFIPTRKLHYLRIGMVMKFLLNRVSSNSVLFVNQNTYVQSMVSNKILCNSRNIRVLFTHFPESTDLIELYKKFLQKTSFILVMNSTDRIKLREIGIPSKKIKIIYGAIDKKIYYPLKSGEEISFLRFPYVLIAGDCKERKDPKRIFSIVQKMSRVQFVFHGNGWVKYFQKEFGCVPLNCQFYSFNIDENAKLMRDASTYLSLSKIEGGPYTTLEALASGTPVVVTRTGWNDEFVNTKNGFLIDLNATDEVIIQAIFASIDKKKEIYKNDLLPKEFSWPTLGNKIFMENLN